MTRSNDEILAALRSAEQRAAMLDELAVAPVPDARVAAELERLLGDEAVYRFPGPLVGEVRLAAAVALAATGRAVRVRARRPMRGSALFDQLEEAGLELPDVANPRAMEAAFILLRERGLLQEHDLTIAPPVDLDALAAAPSATASEPSAVRARPDARHVTEDDIAFYVEALSDPDPEQRAIAAQNLAATPTGAPRVVERLRALLADDAACLVSVPIRIGEVRYLAAHALRAELRFVGDSGVIRVDCIEPLSSEALEQARERAGVARVPGSTALASQLATFEALRRAGHLRARELVLVA